MIIILLIIATIAFFVCCNLLMTNRSIHIIGSLLSVIFILCAVGFTIANFKYHFGMHLATTTTEKYIYPTTRDSNLLVYSKLGSEKKHMIVTYRTCRKQKKPDHTRLDSYVHNEIKVTNNLSPRLAVTKKVYEYNTPAERFWFGIAMKHKLYNIKNTFYVPKTWTVLSSNQAKTVKRFAKIDANNYKKQNSNPQIQMLMQQQSQQIIQEKLMANPPTTSSQEKQDIQKITKQLKEAIAKQTKSKVLQQAISQAKNVPEGYTK